MDFFLFVF